MTRAIYGPAGDDDATPVHLFLCIENGHYAVSHDPSGNNLPRDACLAGWRHVKVLALGVREPLPIAGDPEPVLRGLLDAGYYILPAGSQPHGTGQ